MGVVKRRRTAQPVAVSTAPAVILAPGWVISVDGQQQVVTKVSRIENGPRYRVETDTGTHEWSAAKKIPVISTVRPI